MVINDVTLYKFPHNFWEILTETLCHKNQFKKGSKSKEIIQFGITFANDLLSLMYKHMYLQCIYECTYVQVLKKIRVKIKSMQVRKKKLYTLLATLYQFVDPLQIMELP